MEGSLAQEDVEELHELRSALGTGPVSIGEYFSSPGRHPEALAKELRVLGFDVIVDEEVSGDGYWHVAAFRVEVLTEASLLELMTKLSQAAQRHDATYDGWEWRTTVELRQRFPKL